MWLFKKQSVDQSWVLEWLQAVGKLVFIESLGCLPMVKRWGQDFWESGCFSWDRMRFFWGKRRTDWWKVQTKGGSQSNSLCSKQFFLNCIPPLRSWTRGWVWIARKNDWFLFKIFYSSPRGRFQRSGIWFWEKVCRSCRSFKSEWRFCRSGQLPTLTY